MNPGPLVRDTLSEELTVRDYARSLGITIQTVYRRIWDGRVSARQICGRWLITLELTGTKPQNPDDATHLPTDPKMPR
jgi:hypothetical protein